MKNLPEPIEEVIKASSYSALLQHTHVIPFNTLFFPPLSNSALPSAIHRRRRWPPPQTPLHRQRNHRHSPPRRRLLPQTSEISRTAAGNLRQDNGARATQKSRAQSPEHRSRQQKDNQGSPGEETREESGGNEERPNIRETYSKISILHPVHALQPQFPQNGSQVLIT